MDIDKAMEVIRKDIACEEDEGIDCMSYEADCESCPHYSGDARHRLAAYRAIYADYLARKGEMQ